MMKRMRRIIASVTAVMISCVVLSASDEKKNTNGHYWEWGWGVYYGTLMEPLDIARYDWSLINLGSIPANQKTLELLNKVLEINPQHKFLLRVWPIGGLSKLAENRYQMTLFDYFYCEGIKEKLFQKTKEQIEYFIKGLSKPESIDGISFLEELPASMSSNSWNRWKIGKPLPWDIKAFEKEIEKELGVPFDMMNPQHRLWWGKKYAEMLGDIHKVMKEASGGKKVFYWQQIAMVGTLDELKVGEPMIDKMGHSPVPIYYKDIVKPGFCDGIFGYPGNGMEERCVIPAEKINCLYFTQLSVPSFMRRLKWNDILDSVTKKDPRNIGTFVYAQNENARGVWNAVPWRDNNKAYTKISDYRMVGYFNKVGMKILEKELRPSVKFDYKIDGMKQGDFAHVFVQIFNPVNPSWYGGNANEATMKNLSVRLEVPEGYDLPQSNSAPPLLKLGDLKPYECIAGDWWLRKTSDAPSQVVVLKAIVTWNKGRSITLEARKSNEEIAAFQPHYIISNEEKWVEPAYRMPSFEPSVQIVPLSKELIAPELSSGYYNVKYNDVLYPDEVLVIGPGLKAELHQKTLFSEKICDFESDNQDGTIYDKGYLVYRTPKVATKAGKKYLFRLTGRASDGGNSLVVIIFTCGKDKKEISVLENKFSSETTTSETEVSVPELNGKGQIYMEMYFYRLNQKGSVTYKNFSFMAQEKPKDVSFKLQGRLETYEKFFTIWQFRDNSEPDYHGKPKAIVKFFNPNETNSINDVRNLPYF